MPAREISSRRIVRTAARWTVRLAVGAVVLLLVTAGGVYGVTGQQLKTQYDVPVHPITVRTDSASIARGAHLATIKGCIDCHNADLSGKVVLDRPELGRLAGPNLTRGGRGAALTDADWERAVRHGVRRDGTTMLFMPANEYTTISDEDLADIVAYARSLPGVQSVQPPTTVGPVLRALTVAGQVNVRPAAQVAHATPHLARIDAEPTPAYGKYLAAGCTGCHGEGYGGGKIPGAPPDWKPAANITPGGIGSYSEADFMRVMREGMRPSGVPVDTAMPWKAFRHMTDTEIQALYRYLRTVPAKAYGTR